jgi:adenylate kinase
MGTTASASPPGNSAQTQTADANTRTPLFDEFWRDIEANAPTTGLRFPRRIFWLNGAPGAGKGTHTPAILRHLAIPNQPIVTSDLLNTPEARKIIDAGLLVGDREVLALLLNKLQDPQLADGVVVDGFPRTAPQVESLRAFHSKLAAYNARHGLPAPEFSILVLYVDEAESVARQMKRGRETLAAGHKEAVRKTDLDPELARQRYRVFTAKTLDPLKTLQGTFPYHHIPSSGTIEEVSRRIVEEISQSG